MMKTPAIILACLVTFPVLALPEQREQVSPETTVQATPAGELTETAWRFTDSSGQAFGLHRYREAGSAPVARMLYLPGTNMNGTLTPGTGSQNLWLYLAARGVEVWTLDYRTHFVPHDTSGELDFMRDWTMDLFVSDAEKATLYIREQAPELPLFVAGFSRGVSYAYALAGRQPLSGLVALDGSFKSLPYRRFDLGGALRQYDANGIFATQLSRRGHAWRTALMQDVIDDPQGPAADPRYESAAAYLAETLHMSWGPGVLANTRDGVSSLDVLAREMLAYDWFFPTIQDVEGRAIRSQEDDPRSSLDDHFGSMTLPIIYFGASNFGAESLIAGIHSAGNSGSRDVTIHVLENYGHLDVLFSREAPQEVYSVILDWVLNRSLRVE